MHMATPVADKKMTVDLRIGIAGIVNLGLGARHQRTDDIALIAFRRLAVDLGQRFSPRTSEGDALQLFADAELFVGVLFRVDHPVHELLHRFGLGCQQLGALGGQVGGHVGTVGLRRGAGRRLHVLGGSRRHIDRLWRGGLLVVGLRWRHIGCNFGRCCVWRALVGGVRHAVGVGVNARRLHGCDFCGDLVFWVGVSCHLRSLLRCGGLKKGFRRRPAWSTARSS